MTSDQIIQGGGKRLTLDEFVFIISMGVALNTKVAGYDIPDIIVYGIATFWVVLALYRTIAGGAPLNRGLKPLGVRFAAPKFLILCISYLYLAFGLIPSGKLGGINQILCAALPIASVYLYGRKTIDLIFFSCFVSFLFVVPYTCIVMGLGSLLAPIRAIFDSTAVNPFETHQFTFTAGFLFVYYLMIDKEYGHGWKAVGAFIMCFIGFKRIVLLAVIAVIFVKTAHGMVSKRAETRFYSIGLMLLAVISFTYVALIYNGFIANWMSSHSVNVMGRNYYWQVAVANSSFAPSYLGGGVNSLTHLFNSADYSYLRVGGVHNDILKYYYEIGFFGFICWLLYFLAYLPSWILKVCGTKTFEAYSLVTIFMFILFFTDNVDIYYGSQLLFAAIPMVVWLNSKADDKKGVNGGDV